MISRFDICPCIKLPLAGVGSVSRGREEATCLFESP